MVYRKNSSLGEIMQKKNLAFWVWVTVSVLAILNMLYFDLKIIAAPDSLRIQYIPDDAFYYLGLARNFIQFHTWTFDSGISKTTGFHILYAYILAAIYGIFHPSTSAFVISAIVLCSVTTLLACVYALWVGIRQRNAFIVLALAFIASSTNFITNSISGVEWPFVVLIAALFCGTLYMGFSSRRTPIALFFLGLLGSLARSDFALLPAAFFIAAIFVWIYTKDRSRLRILAWGLVGDIVGIGILFIHNYSFSGSWLQSSAIVKLHWAKYLPIAGRLSFNISLATCLIGGFLVGGLNRILYLISLLPLIIFVAYKALKLWRNRGNQKVTIAMEPREIIFLLAAIISWYGYLTFYMLDGALQMWYTANFVLPDFILLALLGQFLAKKLFQNPDLVLFLLLIPTFFLYYSSYQKIYPLGPEKSLWPHQQTMLAIGNYLHDQPTDGNIGAWNAGIIGFYQGGQVINIDGLVNNDVYPYVLSNTLPSYLDSRKIKYIVDSQSMLDESFRIRGGYDNPAFIQSMVPIKVFDPGRLDWKSFTLFRIKK